jgi:NAD(P)-dependent dehydrogenase (short-subunit alcohol dehydrogenase family)
VDLHLQNRVILVIGGHGLIGSAIARQLRAEGATVVPASRNAQDGLVLDAANDESVQSGITDVRRTHGRLDGLVVAAAPSARTLDPSRNADPQQVQQAFEAKALTFLRAANAALPIMQEKRFGRIVGISGQNAFLTGNITGSIRNAALIIAAKNLADSVAGTGITVNTVSPATVVERPSQTIERGTSGQCRPDDVARLVAFLLSPLSEAISGESIAVGHRVRGVVSL